MTSLVDFPPELMKKLTAFLPYKDHLSLALVCQRLYQFGPPCRIVSLRLAKFLDTINLNAAFVDGYSVSKFMTPHEHELTSTQGKWKESGEINCYRKFAYPPVSEFPLFEEAIIDHLEVNKAYPISVDTENLKHLTALLKGCTIHKISLVFNEDTFINLDSIPDFLARIKSEHVEFILDRSPETDLVALFRRDAFTAALLAAGVRHIAFSFGQSHLYEQREWAREGARPGQLHVITEFSEIVQLVRYLFDAGFEGVTLYQRAFYECEASARDLDVFIDHPPPQGKSLHVEFELRDDKFDQNRYRRADDEQYGRKVKIARLAYGGIKEAYLITIEYNR